MNIPEKMNRNLDMMGEFLGGDGEEPRRRGLAAHSSTMGLRKNGLPRFSEVQERGTAVALS